MSSLGDFPLHKMAPKLSGEELVVLPEAGSLQTWLTEKSWARAASLRLGARRCRAMLVTGQRVLFMVSFNGNTQEARLGMETSFRNTLRGSQEPEPVFAQESWFSVC